MTNKTPEIEEMMTMIEKKPVTGIRVRFKEETLTLKWATNNKEETITDKPQLEVTLVPHAHQDIEVAVEVEEEVQVEMMDQEVKDHQEVKVKVHQEAKVKDHHHKVATEECFKDNKEDQVAKVDKVVQVE